MKFLILTDDAGIDTDRAFVDLEANERWLAEGRKTGQIEAVYSLAGAHGVAMIVDVDSPEALDELMARRPSCVETKLMVHVLADYDAASKTLHRPTRSGLQR